MSHFQNRFTLLKRRHFLLYIIGFLFAAIGNGLGYIAMSWIVISRDNGVTAMAILMACFWGPNIILGPFMGVLADRIHSVMISGLSELLLLIHHFLIRQFFRIYPNCYVRY